MKKKIRTKFGNITCLLLGLVLFFPAAVLPADLKYIRIGEHKDFTRVVFEFRGPVSFKLPELKGEGVLSLVFPDTNTSLPGRIDSETAKWVNTIEFMPREADLVAKLTLAFRYYDVNAFSLSNPERVVLDIKETGGPKKAAIVEESLDKGVDASEIVETPVKEQKALPEQGLQPVITQPESVTLQQPETSPETPEERQEDLAPSPQPLPAEPVASQFPAQEEQPIQASDFQVQEAQPEVENETETAGRHGLEQGPTPWFFVKEGRLEAYLLITLVSLSAVTVGLLAYMIFRKRRRSGKTAGFSESDDPYLSDSFVDFDDASDGGIAEEGGDIDARIAAIDAKIQDALKKIK